MTIVCAANMRENAREFGILRALGLDAREVLAVYVYEALAVVLSAFLLGLIVGLLIAISLTAQFKYVPQLRARAWSGMRSH